MGCALCVSGSFLSSYVGIHFFGMSPLPSKKAKALSMVISSSMVVITIFALKVLFNISFCGGSEASLLEKIIRIGIQGVIFGVIYGLFVDYVLGRFVYNQNSDHCMRDQTTPSCCFKTV